MTYEIKEVIKSIVDTELEQIDKHLKQLDTKERLDFIAKLLTYVVSKQTEIKGDTKQDGEIRPIIIDLGSGIKSDDE